MSTTYTPNPANNPTSITLASDGDPKPVTSVNVGLEGLADKAAHNNWPEQDATKRYPIKLQSLTRILRPTRFNQFAGVFNWNVDESTGYWTQRAVSINALLWFMVEIPDGAQLQTVSFIVKGAAGHAGLPANPFTFLMRDQNVLAGTQSIPSGLGPVVDPSPNVAAYETIHEVTLQITTGLIIDNTTHSYVAQIAGEANANAIVGGFCYGARCSYFLNNIDPGAA